MDKIEKKWYFKQKFVYYFPCGYIKIMKSRHSDLKQICQQFGLVALYTFGSQAKKIKDWMEGRQDDIPLSTSDVDIGVRGGN